MGKDRVTHADADTHTEEYYLAIKKKILPFATTWAKLEGIMLREINQIERDKYSMFSLAFGI